MPVEIKEEKERKKKKGRRCRRSAEKKKKVKKMQALDTEIVYFWALGIFGADILLEDETAALLMLYI